MSRFDKETEAFLFSIWSVSCFFWFLTYNPSLDLDWERHQIVTVFFSAWSLTSVTITLSTDLDIFVMKMSSYNSTDLLYVQRLLIQYMYDTISVDHLSLITGTCPRWSGYVTPVLSESFIDSLSLHSQLYSSECCMISSAKHVGTLIFS